MFNSIDVSTSGLVAQRARMDTIAGNIANAQSTRDENGNVSPFQRRFVTFEPTPLGTADPARAPQGVSYEVKIDETATPRRVHQPGHPDADEQGFVSYPAIDLVTEFVNAMEAGRAYEANVTAIDMSKQMSQLGLRILA